MGDVYVLKELGFTQLKFTPIVIYEINNNLKRICKINTLTMPNK